MERKEARGQEGEQEKMGKERKGGGGGQRQQKRGVKNSAGSQSARTPCTAAIKCLMKATRMKSAGAGLEFVPLFSRWLTAGGGHRWVWHLQSGSRGQARAQLRLSVVFRTGPQSVECPQLWQVFQTL